MDSERTSNMQHVIVPKSYPPEAAAVIPIRVASIQLPRLSPEDRAVLLPHVKRDLEVANG